MREVMFNGPSGGKIEGRYYHADGINAPAAIILHPHPLHGGTMNNKVIYNAFHTFVSRSFSVLRFNFRGVGKSNGVFDHGTGELLDAATALDWLQAHNPGSSSYWIVGFSFGAWIAMQLLMRRPDINNFIAISPPAQSYDFNFLSPCPAPGLIIQGTDDKIVSETAVFNLYEKLDKQKNSDVDYVSIHGADHFFKNQIDELNQAISSYIEPRINLHQMPKKVKRDRRRRQIAPEQPMETTIMILLGSSTALLVLILLFLFSKFKTLEHRSNIDLENMLNTENRMTLAINSSFAKSDNHFVALCNNISQQLLNAMTAQKNQLDVLQQQLSHVAQLNENKMDNMRRTLNENLFRLQDENSKKLEEMRMTVEEKLQSTLEKRLGESFKIVNDNLEMVHKGLGAMQSLASGVGDLKKVLTNVKTRGVWGEAQLDAILQQIMMPNQYESNVAVNNNSQDRVEYAIKLPGTEENKHIWLPIDAKFPLEDYQRLIEAQENGNIIEIEKHSKALETSLKRSAKTIFEKYVNPPMTTDFAIMFLPIEGLYAEALRKTGMIEFIQREFRIVITSPTTLCAILSSLQMGFKTIAIEKHSSNVWRVLESIKPEFAKFADLLGKTRIKLEQASQVIGEAENKTKTIQKKLAKAESPAITNEISHL